MTIKASIFKRYSFIELIWLTICFVYTKIYHRNCRLIRIPIFMRGRRNIFFGNNFVSGYFNRIDAFGPNGCIYFGKNVQINDFNHIAATEGIWIGDDVLIASRVFISDHNHGIYALTKDCSTPNMPPINRTIYSRKVRIEDRVWIGEGVSILPGVTVGAGSIIGAGSVVTHNIPANSIAVGVPARVVRTFEERNGCWPLVDK